MRAALATALLLLAAAAPSSAASPYAGQEGREIKALSAEEVADLLAGRGMGLAKAAELNSHPGPMHVLENADALALAPDQRLAVEASHGRMAEAATRLGAELVAEERALDAAFATASITPAELAGLTGRIGRLQGELRAVHLAAHLEMRAALTPAQVARYDELRGYRQGVPAGQEHGGGHHGRHGGG